MWVWNVVESEKLLKAFDKILDRETGQHTLEAKSSVSSVIALDTIKAK